MACQVATLHTHALLRVMAHIPWIFHSGCGPMVAQMAGRVAARPVFGLDLPSVTT